MKRVEWIILGAAGLAALMACGPGLGARGTSDEVTRELLHYQQVKLHQRLFFVGMAQAESLAAATQAAYATLGRQLLWLPPGSPDLLQGMYRVDRSVTDREGQIHVLAVLEREAAAAYLRQLAVEREGALKLALEGCAEQLQTGEVARARACLDAAKPTLQQARALRVASRAAVGDELRPGASPGEQQAAALEKKLAFEEARRRSILVRVFAYTDERPTGELDAPFGQLIAEQGLRIISGRASEAQVLDALAGKVAPLVNAGQSAGAGYVLAGKVAARFSSEESGQFFAWASGKLRLIETTSGRTVTELSYDHVKGGHITREQAVEKALQNAVERLMDKLRRELRKL